MVLCQTLLLLNMIYKLSNIIYIPASGVTNYLDLILDKIMEMKIWFKHNRRKRLTMHGYSYMLKISNYQN